MDDCEPRAFLKEEAPYSPQDTPKWTPCRTHDSFAGQYIVIQSPSKQRPMASLKDPIKFFETLSRDHMWALKPLYRALHYGLVKGAPHAGSIAPVTDMKYPLQPPFFRPYIPFHCRLCIPFHNPSNRPHVGLVIRLKRC